MTATPELHSSLADLADRHERLVKAAASAPRGQRVRLQQMARAACLERLRAELRGKA